MLRTYLVSMSGKYLSLLVHFTWSTAHREPWLEPNVREDLYSIIGAVAGKRKVKLLAAGAVSDHIHLYTSFPSTISIADFVSAVKANSSNWIHNSFDRLRGFAWQDGYGAFSVSKSDEARVIRYVDGQERHHQKRTFKQEFLSLLAKNEIDYDLRYIWL